jgi:hypothetical protein
MSMANRFSGVHERVVRVFRRIGAKPIDVHADSLDTMMFVARPKNRKVR